MNAKPEASNWFRSQGDSISLFQARLNNIPLVVSNLLIKTHIGLCPSHRVCQANSDSTAVVIRCLKQALGVGWGTKAPLIQLVITKRRCNAGANLP